MVATMHGYIVRLHEVGIWRNVIKYLKTNYLNVHSVIFVWSDYILFLLSNTL